MLNWNLPCALQRSLLLLLKHTLRNPRSICTQETNTFPSPAGPFLTCFHQAQTFLCLPHLLVSYHRSGERDHLGGLLQPAQSRINTEFRPRYSGLYLLRCWKSVGTDFSQPLGNLLQAPWFDSTQFLHRFWPTHSSC